MSQMEQCSKRYQWLLFLFLNLQKYDDGAILNKDQTIACLQTWKVGSIAQFYFSIKQVNYEVWAYK